MLRTLFISLLCLLGTTRAQAWGPKGHDVVAYIAECNLTPEAAEKIDKILGGASMVYWANWLDSASHTPEYAYTATWHYANVDEGFTYETMTKNPDGDIVEAIDRIVAELKGGQLDPAQEQLYLKMLVHLVGDLHQPMHTGHLSDRGGNSVPVRFFGRESNLHAVWDSSLPEAAHKWPISSIPVCISVSSIPVSPIAVRINSFGFILKILLFCFFHCILSTTSFHFN